ncbi:hypothetical protein HH308_18850 [Gordonia sp. TBRC 11910]|uniref:Uncharacterized protein n=1 Tax=Gordonia asplenii TaxID=2725283 RepID=A0A848KYQ4_9ACTN|nr:hypothetical protein [Gordonia asplenii]NMO03277.1 hypothetical protein [Gordonia asplenii]
MKSAQLEQIRTDLSAGYGRIQHTLCGARTEGERQMRSIVGHVKRAVDTSSPTWLPRDIADGVREQLQIPACASDLLAAGAHGMVVFEGPATRTSLGAARSTAGAPVNGLAWWPARLEESSLDYDGDEPELIVVHVLSTEIGDGSPWLASLWGSATLKDIGMFALPLNQEIIPPSAEEDDLAPAIATLLGFGSAVREARLIFDVVGGDASASRTVGCRPRTAAVLAA